MNPDESTGNRHDATDEPRTPLSFLLAAGVFLLTFFVSYGITVTHSLGTDVIKECHYRELDNLAGGVLMLMLAGSYALSSARMIRKDLLHHVLYALVGLGGLYLLYTTCQVWPEGCLEELRYVLRWETWY